MTFVIVLIALGLLGALIGTGLVLVLSLIHI